MEGQDENMDRQDGGYDISWSGGTDSDLHFAADLSASGAAGFRRSKFWNVSFGGNSRNARISAGFRGFSHLFLLIL